MLDTKLKRVAFETAFRHLTRSKYRSTSRMVRNLIESAQLLSAKKLSEAHLQSIQHELLSRIQTQENNDITLNWLLQTFELSDEKSS